MAAFTLDMDITGFKVSSSGTLITLLIPAGTRIVGPTLRPASHLRRFGKMRAEMAIVLNIQGRDPTTNRMREYASANSWWMMGSYGKHFRYTPGQKVYPEYPLDTSLNPCSSGINFFTTVNEARDFTDGARF